MKLRDKILARMIELAKDPASPWELLPSRFGMVTVRRIWTHETPDYQARNWSQPTYDAHTFLTAVGGRTFILGTSAAPWMDRRDRPVPLWLAEAILEDPELSQDTGRQLALVAARRTAALAVSERSES